MLQIITGRFFASSERYVTPGKGILYSNFASVSPIETPVGTLEPVDKFGAVTGYVYSYVNQLEKGDGGPGELIAVGDDEIVRQFSLLGMFGLGAYFHGDRAQVLNLCRPRAISSLEPYVPSRFVPRILGPQVQGTTADTSRFVALLEKALRLPRSKYLALIDVLETLDGALQALNGNLDLAYSMVVYCLESLSQGFDEYEARWSDYEDGLRRKLDKLLCECSADVAEKIRVSLLEAAHVKLSARFRRFVASNIDEAWFYGERANNLLRPIRRSQLDRALKNAYELRSGFVHRLQSIREQLHEPAIAEGEVMTWNAEPYLTFGGLWSTAFEVLKNFVARGESLETEKIEWRSQLSGMVRLQVAPQYWIWQHEGLASLPPDKRLAQVLARLGGFLQIIVSVARGEMAITDMRELLRVYESWLPQSSIRVRQVMLAHYVLFNSVVGSEAISGWEATAQRYNEEMQSLSIETMMVRLMLEDGLGDADYATCAKIYDDYARIRYAKDVLEVPMLLEVKLLVVLANMAKAKGADADRARFLDTAICEAVGDPKIQGLLRGATNSGCDVDPRAIVAFSLATKATTSDQLC